jgi:hypothetical protein
MWLVTTGPSPANTVINQAVTSFEKSHPGDTTTIDYYIDIVYILTSSPA